MMANEETKPNLPEDQSAAEVTIEKWVYGGSGLGRVSGQVVLVPFVLPGETVRYAAHRPKKDLVQARVTEFLTKSADRIEPTCPYFTKCGGCDYQHAPYEFQVARKVEILREVFQRVGKIAAPEVIETLASEPFGYRNRSQFHFAGGQVGFREAGSHKLIPVERCPISSPKVNEALGHLRVMIQDRRWPQFIREVEIFSNESTLLLNVIDTEGGQRIARSFFDWVAARMKSGSAGELDYKVGEDTFRVSHGSFFQVNRFLIEALVQAAIGDAAGGSALDLCCGVGLFTIPLARRFETVTGVESSAAAIRDLEFNAAKAGVTINAQRGNTDLILETLETTPDFVLADPPRAGLGASVVKQLLRLKPPKLTIVSCDPATLARDIAGLAAGGYRIEKLVMADLFPQTQHIECVAHLQQ